MMTYFFSHMNFFFVAHLFSLIFPVSFLPDGCVLFKQQFVNVQNVSALRLSKSAVSSHADEGIVKEATSSIKKGTILEVQTSEYQPVDARFHGDSSSIKDDEAILTLRFDKAVDCSQGEIRTEDGSVGFDGLALQLVEKINKKMDLAETVQDFVQLDDGTRISIGLKYNLPISIQRTDDGFEFSDSNAPNARSFVINIPEGKSGRFGEMVADRWNLTRMNAWRNKSGNKIVSIDMMMLLKKQSG